MKIQLLGLKRLSLALVCGFCLATQPAQAYLPPDLSLRRTQLVQYLPYQQVAELHEWVPQQSLQLSPDEYLNLLHQRFPDTNVAWTFYASWSYLDLLEHTQQAYEQRKADLEHAEELLDQYENRANDVLRLEIEPATTKALTLEPAKAQPSLQQTDTLLRVFRPLPWPELGYSRSQVLQLLEACRQDRAQVEQQRAKVEVARTEFVAHQDRWMDWLSDVAQASQEFTQAEYTRPYDDPLPIPPKGIP